MVCLFFNITHQVTICLFTCGRRSSLHQVDNQYMCQITTWAAFSYRNEPHRVPARVWLGNRREYMRRACTSSLRARPPPTWVCVRQIQRQMSCAFVSVFCWEGGDFVNVFVGICVNDISNKILHAMCVKWRPIHTIYRGSGDPREEREGS